MFIEKRIQKFENLVAECKKNYNIEDINKLQEQFKNLKFFKITSDNPYKLNLPTPNIYFTVWEQLQNKSLKLVGVLKLSVLTAYQNFMLTLSYTIMYISVDSDYQNTGIATKLINTCFKYLDEINVHKLHISQYSESGFKYIKSKFQEYGVKYNIEVIDQDYITFHDI